MAGVATSIVDSEGLVGGTGGSVVGSSTAAVNELNDGIILGLDMDEETTGTRSDSVGSHDATSLNSASYRASVNGNAADFNGTNQGLFIPSDSVFNRYDSDWMAVAGLIIDVGSGDNYMMARWINSPTTSRQWQTWHQTSNNDFYFNVRKDNATQAFCLDPGGFSTGAWHLVGVGYDSSEQEIFLRIDNRTKITTSLGTDLQSVAGSVPFTIGYDPSGNYTDGGCDFFQFGTNIYTDDQWSDLYNSGSWKAGYPYA